MDNQQFEKYREDIFEEERVENFVNQFWFKLISIMLQDVTAFIFMFMLMDFQFTYLIPIGLFDKIFYQLGYGEIYYIKRAFYGIPVMIVFLIIVLFIYAIYLQINEKISMLKTIQKYYWTYIERIKRTKYKIKLN